MSWWTTNKQLRADIKRLEALLVAERGENLSLRKSIQIVRRDRDNALLRAAPTKVPSHIEGMRPSAVASRPMSASAGSVIPQQRLLQDEPGKGVSKLSKTLASKPDARRVVRENYPPPTPTQSGGYKREESSSGATDFLTGADVGMVVNEIFSSSSSSDSSSSCSSDSGISSGGGGDFGGGGASGSFD